MKAKDILRRLLGGDSEPDRLAEVNRGATSAKGFHKSAPHSSTKAPNAFVHKIGEAPQRDVHAALISWLSTRGPDEWHAVAMQWNWDNGAEPLLWIVAQEECDRATAATLFWRATPDTILSCDTVEEAAKAYNKTGYIVASAIAERAIGPGYDRAELGIDDRLFRDPVARKATWTLWCERHLKDVPLPDWIYGPFAGRTVERNYPEGLPRPIIEMVYPKWEKGWGD